MPSAASFIDRSDTAYTQRGQIATVTSSYYGTVRNQVAFEYDGWGNVAASKQAHDGAVTSGTPRVDYAYDDLARLTSVTYPFDPAGAPLPPAAAVW